MRLMFVFLCCSIMGCANPVIKKQDRDTSGKFDGSWTANAFIKKHTTVLEGAGRKWRVRCGEEKFSFPLYINFGRISAPGMVNGGGYIKEDGTFYSNWELENTQDAGLYANRRLIFAGALGDLEGEGSVILTVDSPTQGCKGKVRFTKN